MGDCSSIEARFEVEPDLDASSDALEEVVAGVAAYRREEENGLERDCCAGLLALVIAHLERFGLISFETSIDLASAKPERAALGSIVAIFM